jgi:hypothetical protein
MKELRADSIQAISDATHFRTFHSSACYIRRKTAIILAVLYGYQISSLILREESY